MDKLFNIADHMVEDILNTLDDEILDEVTEDYDHPMVLTSRFDQVLARLGLLPEVERLMEDLK